VGKTRHRYRRYSSSPAYIGRTAQQLRKAEPVDITASFAGSATICCGLQPLRAG
jgi:hypothetical protein